MHFLSRHPHPHYRAHNARISASLPLHQHEHTHRGTTAGSLHLAFVFCLQLSLPTSVQSSSSPCHSSSSAHSSESPIRPEHPSELEGTVLRPPHLDPPPLHPSDLPAPLRHFPLEKIRRTRPRPLLWLRLHSSSERQSLHRTFTGPHLQWRTSRGSRGRHVHDGSMIGIELPVGLLVAATLACMYANL